MGSNGHAKLPFFAMYPTDFLLDAKVQQMKPHQKGFYALLLFHAWVQNPPGTLPCDDPALAKLLGLSLKQWLKEKDAVLQPFHFDTDDRWHQKRMELEYEKAAARSEKARQNIAKRWQKKEYGRNTDVLLASNTIASDVVCSNLNLKTPDPNTYIPPRAVHYVDPESLPFPPTAFWKHELLQKAMRHYLTYLAEHPKFPWRMIRKEFDCLCSNLQREFPTATAVINAITTTESRGWKHIKMPSETGKNS